jgi:hypothetical protein
MPETEPDDEFVDEQEKEAAAEAGAIGGRVSSEPPTELEQSMSEAERPLSEAGEGESEGFELAEMELEEHASHGDAHAARRILEDASLLDEDDRVARDGEADSETPPDA